MSLPLPQRRVSARRAFVARTLSLSFGKSKGCLIRGCWADQTDGDSWPAPLEVSGLPAMSRSDF